MSDSRSRPSPQPSPRFAGQGSKKAGTGGCGVLGLISNRTVPGGAIAGACSALRNRGNGKAGGVAAGGLDAAALEVGADVLRDCYLLAVAYLEPAAKAAVEAEFVRAAFDVRAEASFPTAADHRALGLERRPPDVCRYFVRAKPAALDRFCREGMGRLPHDRLERERWEDEFVFQNSYRLNAKRYASPGKQSAFVLSHAKDLLVLKLVGYAEDAIRFYGLEKLGAKLWIGHQGCPTQGKAGGPGGASPFAGLHEALAHSGDLANFSRIVKYLGQRNLAPQFFTDAEVSARLFDLWLRAYRYPLEMALEAMAPTTERDFELLPPHRQRAYRALQAASIKGSPDGPWSFVVARSDAGRRELQLLGATDTSMLRPQVFALQDRAWRQDAADRENARGRADTARGRADAAPAIGLVASEKQAIDRALDDLNAAGLPFAGPADSYWSARGGSHSDGGAFAFTLTHSGELRAADKFGFPVRVTGVDPKRELARRRGEQALAEKAAERSVGFAEAATLAAPGDPEALLQIDAAGFATEGHSGLADFIRRAWKLGWRKMRVLSVRGHRFIGCGLGPGAQALQLDCHGSPGDYLGSGLSGGTLRVFNDAQDQTGQLLAGGKLVIYGDVGHTLLYGATAGECYVLGNAAGRPLIEAAGKLRAVINGTCLDHLAESFRAGDALKDGGFVIVNALRILGDGRVDELETPYPGGDLFARASGGAVYFRDPRRAIGTDQLNGGRILELEASDWQLIEPYLRENERLFGIPVDLLAPSNSYIKIVGVTPEGPL